MAQGGGSLTLLNLKSPGHLAGAFFVAIPSNSG